MPIERMILRGGGGAGTDTTSADGTLAPGEARRTLNLFFNRQGKLSVAGGQAGVLSSPTPVTGFTRFENKALRRLVWTRGDGTNPQSVLARDEATGVDQNLSLTLSPAAVPRFAVHAGRLVVTDSGGDLLIWWGDATLRVAGVPAPTVAPVPADSGPGPLDSQGGVPYQWSYTFTDDHGVESNPSPASDAALGYAAGNTFTFLIAASAPAYAATLNLYRIGGLVSEWRLVKSVPVAFASPLPTLTDAVADTELSLIQREIDHDRPVGGFDGVILHKNRLWAWGMGTGRTLSPARLWYTKPGQPEYWPAANYIDLDDDYTNPILACATLGSLLIILRRRSIHALYGNSIDDFAASVRANIGIAGPEAVARCGNELVFVGSDRMIYRLGDVEPEAVSTGLRDTFAPLPASVIAGASCAYIEQRFVVTVPRSGQAAVSYAWDFTTQKWTELSSNALNCRGLTVLHAVSAGQRAELLARTAPGFRFAGDGPLYQGIVRLLSDADPVQQDILWQSDGSEMGLPDYDKLIRKIRVTGDIAAGAVDNVPPTVQVIVDGNNYGPEIPVQSLKGTLLETMLPRTLVGRRVQITLRGRLSSGFFDTIELDYIPVSQRRGL